ncbi:MAG: 3-oxoacyl-ACP reductase, partial [Oceanospirillum sp.]|nr:3-oxoacyl-ACP reductase [Oceanospirillum sp.]
MKHENRVVFVTGAGQGMGKAIVERFVAEGALVAAVDINQQAAQAVADSCGAGLDGTRVIGLACDVSDSSSVRDAMAEVERQFGRLDIVVNNAGTNKRADEPHLLSDEDWRDVIDTNLTSM